MRLLPYNRPRGAHVSSNHFLVVTILDLGRDAQRLKHLLCLREAQTLILLQPQTVLVRSLDRFGLVALALGLVAHAGHLVVRRGVLGSGTRRPSDRKGCLFACLVAEKKVQYLLYLFSQRGVKILRNWKTFTRSAHFASLPIVGAQSAPRRAVWKARSSPSIREIQQHAGPACAALSPHRGEHQRMSGWSTVLAPLDHLDASLPKRLRQLGPLR